MEKIICIYCVKNTVNNKKYIGSAIDFNRRKRVHLQNLKSGRHHSYKLQNSFNKYGEVNFIFEILEVLDSKEEIIQREQFYLDKLKPELNVTLIAGLNSHLGLKRTQETKDKIRKSNIGRVISDETREKLRFANLGKKQSDETIRKKVESMRKSEYFNDPIRKQIKTNKAKETRLKNGGYFLSTEHREKISKTLKNKNLQSVISKKILKFDLDFNLIEIYPSISKAEKLNNLSPGSLKYNISKRKKEEYKGYIWKII